MYQAMKTGRRWQHFLVDQLHQELNLKRPERSTGRLQTPELIIHQALLPFPADTDITTELITPLHAMVTGGLQQKVLLQMPTAAICTTATTISTGSAVTKDQVHPCVALRTDPYLAGVIRATHPPPDARLSFRASPALINVSVFR